MSVFPNSDGSLGLLSSRRGARIGTVPLLELREEFRKRAARESQQDRLFLTHAVKRFQSAIAFLFQLCQHAQVDKETTFHARDLLIRYLQIALQEQTQDYQILVANPSATLPPTESSSSSSSACIVTETSSTVTEARANALNPVVKQAMAAVGTASMRGKRSRSLLPEVDGAEFDLVSKATPAAKVPALTAGSRKPVMNLDLKAVSCLQIAVKLVENDPKVKSLATPLLHVLPGAKAFGAKQLAQSECEVLNTLQFDVRGLSSVWHHVQIVAASAWLVEFDDPQLDKVTIHRSSLCDKLLDDCALLYELIHFANAELLRVAPDMLASAIVMCAVDIQARWSLNSKAHIKAVAQELIGGKSEVLDNVCRKIMQCVI